MANLQLSAQPVPSIRFDIPYQHRNASGIYAIKNLANGKVYVGSAVNLRKRFLLHTSNLTKGNHCNTKLSKAVTKYGFDNFSFTLLSLCDLADLLQVETTYIDSLKSVDTGYNICKEGRSALGVKRSLETRKKLSESLKGKHLGRTHVDRQLSESGRERFRSKMVGKPSKLKGVPRSLAVKEKVSKALTGKSLSVEHRAALSVSHKGYIMPQYQKDKIAASNTGRRQSEASIKKTAEAHYRPVSKFDLNGVLIQTYASVKEAMILNNIKGNNIPQVCSGKRNKAGGFIWRYAE